VHRIRTRYTTTQKATDLLGGYVEAGESALVMLDFGHDTRVDIQYSPEFGLAARTISGKWRECWNTPITMDEVGELLDETRRFLPIIGDHVMSDLDDGWDRHAADPLYFATAVEVGHGLL